MLRIVSRAFRHSTFIVHHSSFVVFSSALCLHCASCSSSNSYLPDEVGTAWTYSIRTGFGAEHVASVRVERRLTVAGADGFEMSGSMGAARMAWKRGALWVESLPNVRMKPPVPLLRLDREPAAWSGTLFTALGEERAKGRLTHASEKLKSGGRTFATVKTELSLERPRGATVLTTWFAEGIGIVRQEQRTKGALDLRIEWVAGPTNT